MNNLDIEKYEPQSTEISFENEKVSNNQSVQEIKQFYKQQPVEEDLDFEDLGIIEIDDEEWNEEYLEEQKIQKYQICKKRPKSRLKSSKSHKEAQIDQTEEFELQNEYQQPIRPQNQLLRPLTPPIKKQNGDFESEAIFETNPELYCKLAAQWVKQKKVNETQKKQKNKLRPFSAKYKQRPDQNYQLERKDSAELFEQLSSSSSNSIQYTYEQQQKHIEWEKKEQNDISKQDDEEEEIIDSVVSGPQSVELKSDTFEKNDNFEEQLKNELFEQNFIKIKDNENQQTKQRPKSPKYSGKNSICKTQNQKKQNVYCQILDKKEEKKNDKKNDLKQSKQYNKFQELLNQHSSKKEPKKLFNQQVYQSVGAESKKNQPILQNNYLNQSNQKNSCNKKDK